MIQISHVTGFEWDAGNTHKSYAKHGITPQETEEIFFNVPLLLTDDAGHSQQETRCMALGKTNTGKRLLVVFVIRGTALRPISTRPMSRKERLLYDAQTHPSLS